MRMLIRFARWCDNTLWDRFIPIEQFGWVKLTTWRDDFGIENEAGHWTTSRAERDRFSHHNAELMRLAAFFRAVAWRLERWMGPAK